jgi:hypothetical protein
MSAARTRLSAAFDRFDAANAGDPNKIIIDGVETARALLYAQQMTAWQRQLYPSASDALQLAARAQHIRRWEVPRESFPMDRAGYHRWRTTLYTFHADVAAAILRELTFDDRTIERVRALLRKEKLKTDPETQALEDVACVVFLENYFAAFAAGHEEEKVIAIVRRTWAKMSPHGHAAAMTLSLPDKAQELVARALTGEGGG